MAYRKKLIEVALPLPEINDASAYDKMPGIGPHPKGIHHWWARLPLPTARAILFASVVDDPEAHPEKWPTEDAQNTERERLFDIVRRMMGKKLHEHPEVYAQAREEMLKHCDGKLPAVFDPFAGGGSIPLEANRLGFEAHAGDLNPVAVLLNKCNLELAPRWAGCAPVNVEDRCRIGGEEHWRGTTGLAADVRYYGRIVRERAQAKIGHLYPNVRLPKEHGGGEANVIAWIWARTVASPNPAAHGKHVPLASSFVLSAKTGHQAWVETVIDPLARDGWRFSVQTGNPSKDQLSVAKRGTKAGKAENFICSLTKTPIQRSYIQSEGKAKRLGMRLMTIVAEGRGGRIYVNPTEDHERVALSVVSSPEVRDARDTLLSGPLPTRAEITGGVCTAYGLNSWGHLFNERQILALLTLSDLLPEILDAIKNDAKGAQLSDEASENYARVVLTFLALAIDRCGDFNNSLCRWSASNQKVMNLFARQALPMVFDFAEANILGGSVGAWETCCNYVSECIRVISTNRNDASSAKQLDAASAQNSLSNIIVSTDPPYYNNISYATLSDFFYVWLRRSLGRLYSDLFDTVLVPKLPELIAAPNRFDGDALKAKEHFESGFRNAFTTLRNKMDPRFPLTVYYAFKQNDEESDPADGEGEAGVDLTTGWETLLEALIGSGFQITATWPVRASQAWRMVSMGTNALASYIVLACRARPADAPQTDRRSFITELKRELPIALRHLQQGNIAPVDFAQAAIGPGMAVYSRYGRILESSGKPMSVRGALSLINQTLAEVLSAQEDEFDADTRWALAWFEQSGFAEGEYGVAEILSKAKNTSVGGMVEAGIVTSSRGKVRLLKPDELQDDWDPTVASRFTAWEIVHQLIRALSMGEEATAALVAKLGTKAATARELAYQLYSVCERKKRTAEALAYNALVQSWPEIVRIARAGGKALTEQPQLFEQE
jgi:putative DNA methylase